MSILDDYKRSKKGAKALLTLMQSSSGIDFEKLMSAYADADGIINGDFLAELEKAKEFLSQIDNPANLKNFNNFSLPFQFALVEQAIAEVNHDFLLAAQEITSNKNMRKELARRIHELRAKGVEIVSPKKKNKFKFRPVEETQPDTVFTESDIYGNREIIFGWHQARQGSKVLHLVENFQEGILDFHLVETTRSGYRDILKNVKLDTEQVLFHLPPATGYHLIERAIKRNETSGKHLPNRFLTSFLLVPKPSAAPIKPPSEDSELVNQAFLELGQSHLLHGVVELRYWTLPIGEIEQFKNKFQELAQSIVITDERKRVDMILELINKTVDEYFIPEARNLWILRLRDAAVLLNSYHLTEPAIGALAVAKALAQNERPASSISFCEQLLGKFVAGAIQKQAKNVAEIDEQEDRPKGRIILP